MHDVWPTQWEHPEVLWGLTALPLLVYLLWHEHRLRRRTLQQWSEVAYVIRHSAAPSRRAEVWRAALLLSSFTLAVLGFASPLRSSVAWEPAWEHVALGLLCDVSPSMRAAAETQDTEATNRLGMMKLAVEALLTRLPSGVRVGVVVFAGIAVPLVPEPSADLQAVMAKVRRLDTTFMTNPGSNLTAAMQQGLALFTETEPSAQPATAALILLSDGDTEMTQVLQETVRQASLPIYTLGLGTPWPVPIPDSQSPTGFMVTPRGLPVTTTVNESLLRFIADQTGGLYYPFTASDALARTLQTIVAEQSQQVRRPVRRARAVRQPFFLLALGCLLLYQLQSRTGITGWR